jgi:hypothetical protein
MNDLCVGTALACCAARSSVSTALQTAEHCADVNMYSCVYYGVHWIITEVLLDRNAVQ